MVNSNYIIIISKIVHYNIIAGDGYNLMDVTSR